MSRKRRVPEKLAKDELDAQVDESLKETFPASDPPSIGSPTRRPPKGRPVNRKPPVIDKSLVRRLAEKAGKT
ncbi:MAG: hypothetical protein AB7O43_07755 [Hyphomicrobiaceae bacterium]